MTMAMSSGALGTNYVSSSANPQDLLDTSVTLGKWPFQSSASDKEQWAGWRVWKVGQNAHLDAEKGIMYNLEQAVMALTSALVGS